MERTDYLVLVNPLHAIPEDWEKNIVSTEITNAQGTVIQAEKTACAAYLNLKNKLAQDGITVDLDSAYRTAADQQRIADEFRRQYGDAYAQKTVANPGHSEHQTGLAFDLYLIVDGRIIDENEDMLRYPEIWAAIHARLADYGFILRYPEGKEAVTGYDYEPWHIRYVGKEAADAISAQGLTLEEYLG